MTFDAILAVAGIVTVATITPGPNNFIVLHAAAHGGLRATTRLIASIVAGGLVLLCLIWFGAAWVSPGVHLFIGCGGAVYLLWLGTQMIVTSNRSKTGDDSASNALPNTWLAVFFFQLSNPKAWVLLLTLASAARALEHAWAFPSISAIFIGISAVCLITWSYMGSLVGTQLAGHRAEKRFNNFMACLMIVSAFGLLVSLLDSGVQ